MGNLGAFLNRRRLQVFQQASLAAFAPVSALAVATEATRRVEQIRAVHPHDASFQLCRNVQRHVDVLAPNARRQAIDGIVGQLNRFPRSAKCHCGEHRTEDLLLRDDRCRMYIAKQRGRIIKASRRQRDLRLPAGCALSDPLINHALDTIELHAGNNGADIDCLVQRKTDAQVTHALPDLADQGLRDTFLHQQARASTAYLTLVEPDAVHQSFDCAVQISVIEDDEWGLSAQLKRKALVGCCRGIANRAPNLSGTRERDFVDVRMFHQRLAG